MNIKNLTKDKIQDKFNKEAILKQLTEKDYVIYINTKSNLISSKELANKLKCFAINGKSNIIVIYTKIGDKLLLANI